jgi:hypothetical protein
MPVSRGGSTPHAGCTRRPALRYAGAAPFETSGSEIILGVNIDIARSIPASSRASGLT